MFKEGTKIFCAFLAASLMAGLAAAEQAVIPLGSSPTAKGLSIAAKVEGFVRELGSPDAIAGALITDRERGLETETDNQGHYQLQGVAGTWKLQFSAEGYAPVSRLLQMAPGQILRLDLRLKPNAFQAEAVVVRGQREKPQPVQATVSQHEIKEIPGTFGDALRAVQNLPGVAMPSDLSGQLAVQGGGPNDNLYLIDNIPWPFPFHFGGIVSTVDADLLNSVEIYEAGYGARWGGSLSSVLDAKTKAPDTDRLHLSADLSLISADGFVEGPLGVGDASFTLAGRRSYFDLILGRLETSLSREGAGGGGSLSANFPSYWDTGGSLNFSLTPKDHFHLLALAADDYLGASLSLTGGSTYSIFDHQNYTSSGLSWVNTAFTNFTSTLTPYFYTTLTERDLGSIFKDNENQNSYGLKEEAEWQAGETLGLKHNVGFGGDVELSDYQLYGLFPPVRSGESFNFNNLTSVATLATTVTAQGLNAYAYIQDRIQVNPALALTLGLHYDKSSLVGSDFTGPRFSLEWAYDERTKWTLAWGLYSQPPSPLQVNPTFGNPGLGLNQAQHLALSLEKMFSRELSAKVDVYYKSLYNLVSQDFSLPLVYGNEGVGQAYGLDLYLKEDLGEKFFGWISYSLSNTQRLWTPSQGWSLYQYDQPQILNLVASYCPMPDWTVGAKLRYNSGPLVKPVLYWTYDPASQSYIPTLDQNYTQRLEDYLRLDIRADHTWRFETWQISLYVEVLNLLARANPSGLAYNSSNATTSQMNDLPRIPYFGLEAKY